MERKPELNWLSAVFRQIVRSYVRVVAGLHMWSDPGAHSQIRSISEMKVHEDYDDFTSDSDIMLLRLSSPFKFTDHVQPACTPYSVTHEVILNFTHCFITGWGSSSYKGWCKGWRILLDPYRCLVHIQREDS